MKQKNLMVMTACGAILTLLGLALDSGRNSRAAWSRASEPIFPNLPGQVDGADTLVIESAMGTTTLTRDGDDWAVVERGGFPGRGDEVGRLLVALAQAIRVEPMTSRPDLHSQLGLGGFEDEASPTVRLTVREGADTVLADIYIGNRRSQGVGEGWYVREPGSDQAWAVQAKLRCPRQTSEWLQTELMNIARDRIARVHLEGAAGELVQLERQGEGGAGFDIQNLPQGREPKTLASAGGFLGSLASLRITDVQSAASAEFPEEGTSRTTWWTRGGLRILAELSEQADNKLLARFTFGYDADSSAQPALGPALDAEEGDENPLPTPAELETEATELNAATRDWVFTLPSWKKSSFITTMEDLLRPMLDEEDEDQEGVPAPVPVPEEPEIELPVIEVEAEEITDDSQIVEELLIENEEVVDEDVIEEEVVEDQEVDDDGR